ncbi:DUF1501 domain-containing protein [Allorhodopirellula heiligendammensis]|uniref:Sulfatase n=1 Tax=Allorhodopirellula heiligendammensis TaxID=2714739 RepID=A0A5C6C4I5_9BACT|nr:DUF1501 domain-containing protein [Allorhodopirellula heiligendammensis]TWU19463.1 hypothetical protein Poly21_16360 [Allorhodopirellula heiligendammensis]
MDVPIVGRRQMLQHTACGFGALAAQALFAESSPIGSAPALGIAPATHQKPRAKRIIFLFMQGGVSQVDSFDYKPLLAQRNGERLTFDDSRQLAKTGRATEHRLMHSPWTFRRYGESGRWASDLFPNMSRHIDEMCMLHAMHTEGVAHGPATLFLHCGATNFIRPSFGSWLMYGLGSENRNLPGFVSIAPSVGNGGARNYGSAFLPPQFQGTALGNAGGGTLSIDSLTRADMAMGKQREQFELLRELNSLQLQRRGSQDVELEAAIESHELAWRMQGVAPEVLDLSTESSQTHEMYGLNDPHTKRYGERCLLARRLSEAGVRFIQVNYGDNSANPAWDQHSNLPKHADHARAVDQPVAALLQDLKQRGLLDDTIVWWGSEFGRTPYAQDNGTGRDHNPRGFTVWLAGGGFQSGYSHGATDEFGFQGVEGRVHMHDLHATLLHQLGLDHKRLTFEHAGRDFRLTDVHGRIVDEIIG